MFGFLFLCGTLSLGSWSFGTPFGGGASCRTFSFGCRCVCVLDIKIGILLIRTSIFVFFFLSCPLLLGSCCLSRCTLGCGPSLALGAVRYSYIYNILAGLLGSPLTCLPGHLQRDQSCGFQSPAACNHRYPKDSAPHPSRSAQLPPFLWLQRVGVLWTF